MLSCSEDEDNQDFPYTIGFSQLTGGDVWRQTMHKEMEGELLFYPGASLVIRDADYSNEQQIADVEQFIKDEVDLLIVSPNAIEPITPAVEKAYRKGIPVILIDRKIDSDQYTSYIGGDNLAIGEIAANYLVSLLGRNGRVVQITGDPAASAAQERKYGFEQKLKEISGIEIVGEANGYWIKDGAEKAMEILILESEGPFDAVYAHNDVMARAAKKVLSSHSGYEQVKVLGVDGLPGPNGGVAAVLNGEIDATFLYPTGGDLAIKTAIDILSKQPFKRENILQTAAIDSTNARVLALQSEQLFGQQSKIEHQNKLISEQLLRFNAQQTILLLIGALLIIFLILSLISVKAYRSKLKANFKLNRQNLAIEKQRRELAEKHEKLIDLNNRLEEVTRAKMAFFSNISHEFKTPLSLILSPVEKLLSKPNLSYQDKQTYLLVYKHVNLLQRLINQLLDFRKIEDGKMCMTITPVSFSSFLQNIFNSFSHHAKMKKINYSFRADLREDLLWLDQDKVEKVFYNLIFNAFKFTDKGGTISVEISEDQENVHIEIMDNGEGIADVEAVFERYYQVNSSALGTGIGLSLCKQFTEMHKGKIQAESQTDVGTVFTVSFLKGKEHYKGMEGVNIMQSNLPESEGLQELYAKNSLFEYSEKESATPLVDDAKPVLLLVEDNNDLRTYLKGSLSKDFKILEATNGREALLLLNGETADIILSDVKMPEMDGFQLCESIKKDINFSHIPLVLLTAKSEAESREIGFGLGADSYISKPFNMNLVSLRLRKMVENREKWKKSFQNNLLLTEKKEGEAENRKLSKTDVNFLNQIIDILNQNLDNSQFSVEELSNLVGISRIQLYRKVKSLTNYTPNEFIKTFRLKKAKELLEEKNYNINEISMEVGFSNPSYFSKCFKKHFGYTPSEV
ncbi:hybrid sensor histidine kinase/response regulator transcription factor [Litoribacter populi]|uniref:hybrid sensor histidine kinase/response regulator transcription factor n=1 Tax=Litoribacter populi TaxID=2598460 RepID=UPI00163DB472|nr:substrate-binding domain-containing protein [Litoribacter populi]